MVSFTAYLSLSLWLMAPSPLASLGFRKAGPGVGSWRYRYVRNGHTEERAMPGREPGAEGEVGEEVASARDSPAAETAKPRPMRALQAA